MSQPPNSTIVAPCATCQSTRGVRSAMRNLAAAFRRLRLSGPSRRARCEVIVSDRTASSLPQPQTPANLHLQVVLPLHVQAGGAPDDLARLVEQDQGGELV